LSTSIVRATVRLNYERTIEELSTWSAGWSKMFRNDAFMRILNPNLDVIDEREDVNV
jgi:hypothetical protein